VSYFAAAAARSADGWLVADVSLAGASDVEDVAERLREVAPEANISLLFVESDDAYLVILRLDEGEDLRVFGSDAAFSEESRIGAVLLGDIEEPAIELDLELVEGEAESESETEGEEPAAAALADADPVGDADLLADLGIPASRLLALCAQEGMLPSDVTAELCQTLGFADQVEELREA
jgi:putative tRNA adenosine deaminase-associated protein